MKKAAEILVECGYAKEIAHHFYYMPEEGAVYVQFRKPDPFDDPCQQKVDPFADTLEGRRQADAIEDWLHQNKVSLLIECKNNLLDPVPYNGRQKRLDRIEWCLEELSK